MKPVLIAELAKVHDGDFSKAEKLILNAKEAGFDAVKFQAYDLADIMPSHPNAERYKKCHLSLDQLSMLRDYSISLGMDCWCSIFSRGLVEPLSGIFSRVKIPSTFMRNYRLVTECMYHFNEVHISTGMHTVEEIEECKKNYGASHYLSRPVFYHCTSLYPTPAHLERLGRIRDLHLTGFSYHGNNVRSVVNAYLLGAKYIELHYNPVAEPWQWNDMDMVELKEKFECLQKSMEDSPLTEKETSNFAFYSGEYESTKC
jgi:N-acetylneuraminate synthase